MIAIPRKHITDSRDPQTISPARQLDQFIRPRVTDLIQKVGGLAELATLRRILRLQIGLSAVPA
jgi:hypothetical protein